MPVKICRASVLFICTKTFFSIVLFTSKIMINSCFISSLKRNFTPLIHTHLYCHYNLNRMRSITVYNNVTFWCYFDLLLFVWCVAKDCFSNFNEVIDWFLCFVAATNKKILEKYDCFLVWQRHYFKDSIRV